MVPLCVGIVRSGKADPEAEVANRGRQCVDGTELLRCTRRRWRALSRHLERGLKPVTVCCDRGWVRPIWPIDPAFVGNTQLR